MTENVAERAEYLLGRVERILNDLRTDGLNDVADQLHDRFIKASDNFVLAHAKDLTDSPAVIEALARLIKLTDDLESIVKVNEAYKQFRGGTCP